MSIVEQNGTALRPIDQFRADLKDKQETLLATAPAHINSARFLELAARSCIGNPKLLDCSRASLFTSVAEAATLGLDLDGVLGQAYLVPYGREATLVPGYKGIKELAYRSGKVSIFDWAIVRPDDEFEYRKGTEQFLNHSPCDGVSSDYTHVWAMGVTVDGGKRFEVMSKEQVCTHRDKYAKGWQRKGSAWTTNPEAMALKTVATKVMKLLPLSTEAQRLIERATHIETVPFDEGELLDGDTTPAEDLDQLADSLEPSPEEQEQIRQQELNS